MCYTVARPSVWISQSDLLIVNQTKVNINGLILIAGVYVCVSTLLVLAHWLMADHREYTAGYYIRSYLWHCAQMFAEECNKELLATSTSPGPTWCHSTL